VTELIESGQSSMSYEDFDLVRRSALSDAIAAGTEFDLVKDVSGLGVERNLFRYRPVPVSIRMSEDADLPKLLRILAAATVARSKFDVSTPVKLPSALKQVLKARDIPRVVESDAAWLARVASDGPAVQRQGDPERAVHRIRLIGGDAVALAAALRGTPDVAIYAGAVTPSGRVEVLPFLHEQAISITNHRFGNPTHFSDAVI